MFCEKCGKSNPKSNNFCQHCGTIINKNNPSSPVFGPTNNHCQVCGSLTPTKYVEFYQNIGMLVMRQSSSIKGNLCKKCINREFKKRTLTTLFLGWWGMISFFLTPIYLINNIGRFVPTIGMRED